MPILTDEQAWIAYPHDRWIYDRLRLADKLGYDCGPAGVDPGGVSAEHLWMKPIINLDGMGLGSQPYRHPVPPGYFWMPKFVGQHLSADYRRTLRGWECVLAVVATYQDGLIRKWSRWRGHVPPVPKCLSNIGAPELNVEYIGGMAIKAHLRHNPDFRGRDDAQVLEVLYEGDSAETLDDIIEAIKDCDGQLVPARVGFRVAA